MKERHEVKFDFRQDKFLKQIDSTILDKAAVSIAKEKSRLHRSQFKNVMQQQKAWERQASLMREGSGINVEKAEREYKLLAAAMAGNPVPDWRRIEPYTKGRNPRFHAPNFFNIGYGRSVGGVNYFDTWAVDFGSGEVPVPYSSPADGLMGVKIGTTFPGGNSTFNTGLANLFFSQSAQTIPLSANFLVHGGGFSLGMGLGYSRAWLRLGVEAWVAGPSHPTPLHFRFVNDFWSSVPSPWVYEHAQFDGQAFGTGTHNIAVQPGDLVWGSAVIEQGSMCAGWATASHSEFLVAVAQLEIGP